LDLLVLAREELGRAAETGGDLVEDDVDAKAATELDSFGEEAGRMDEHAGSALDQRLEHERGDLVGAAGQLLLEAAKGLRAIGSGGRRNRNALHEEWPEDAVKEVNAADTDRAEGVAVIGLGHPQEALLGWTATQLPVLERLLERDLDGGRAGVRI